VTFTPPEIIDSGESDIGSTVSDAIAGAGAVRAGAVGAEGAGGGGAAGIRGTFTIVVPPAMNVCPQALQRTDRPAEPDGKTYRRPQVGFEQ
jgi:hypothetical protein